MANFLLKDGQTFVFIGDSITDCGRRDSQAPYGGGYVKLAIDLITVRYPQRRIKFFNEGIGGNTIEDLRGRWHDDVLVHNPDWVSVKIGINDLHRHLGNPSVLPPDQYEKLYRECLDLTRKHTRAKLILVDPFYISTDFHSGSWRSKVLALIPKYTAVVRNLAKTYGALHVRTHERFQELLKSRPADYFCPEPVHPYVSGHLVIALGILEALNW